jgi:hypothetical protein
VSTPIIDDDFEADMADLRAMAATVFGCIDYLQGTDREHVLGNLAVVEKLYDIKPAVVE